MTDANDYWFYWVAYSTKNGAAILEIRDSYAGALEALRPALDAELKDFPLTPAYYEENGELVPAKSACPDFTIAIENAERFLVTYMDNPTIVRQFADAMQRFLAEDEE